MATQAETQDSLVVAVDTFSTSTGKSVVVSDSLGQINVSVYKNDGTEQTKLLESTYENGQEITSVYVTSPFLPDSWRNAWRHKNHFRAHLPSLFLNGAALTSGAFSLNDPDGMHLDNMNTGYWGLGAGSLSFPLNRQETFGMGIGIAYSFNRICFDKDYALFNVEGKNVMLPIETEGTVKSSYLSYHSVTIPIVFEYQPRGADGYHLGAGFSLEYRFKEHSRYKIKHGDTITPTHDVNLNHVGLNFDVYAGVSDFLLHLRAGLTPLFKGDTGLKCHTLSFGVGICL